MVANITPAMGKAMATQARRVNNSPAALKRKLLEVTQERDYWKQRAEWFMNRMAGVEIKSTAESAYISASEFARRHQVAVSTITRKYHAGKLAGYENDSGYIFLKADQGYVKGKRGK